MAKKYWKDTYDYRRILEILNDYWLEEEDEEEVIVTMHFKHHNCEEQEKQIVWRNQKYINAPEMLELQSLADLMEDDKSSIQDILKRLEKLEKTALHLSIRLDLMEEDNKIRTIEAIREKLSSDSSLTSDEATGLMQREIDLERMVRRK